MAAKDARSNVRRPNGWIRTYAAAEKTVLTIPNLCINQPMLVRSMGDGKARCRMDVATDPTLISALITLPSPGLATKAKMLMPDICLALELACSSGTNCCTAPVVEHLLRCHYSTSCESRPAIPIVAKEVAESSQEVNVGRFCRSTGRSLEQTLEVRSSEDIVSSRVDAVVGVEKIEFPCSNLSAG